MDGHANVPATHSSRPPRFVCPECQWSQEAPGRCREHAEETLVDTREDAVKLWLGDTDDARVRRWVRRWTIPLWLAALVVAEAVLYGLSGPLAGNGGQVLAVLMLYVAPAITFAGALGWLQRRGGRLRLHDAWSRLPHEQPPTPGERKHTGRRGLDKVLARGAKYGWRREG